MVIKFLTINAKGLSHPAKRSSLWKLAIETQCDVLWVQEMHFKISSLPLCSHSPFPHIFAANATSKKRDVLMAIKATLLYQLHNSILDPAGRYIILACSPNNSIYTLVNVYAPKVHQTRFLRKLKRKIDNKFLIPKTKSRHLSIYKIN